MAATANRLTLIDMQSKLAAVGGVSEAVIGEPRSVGQSGLVAIIPENGRVDETVLNSWREVHIVTLRRYENFLAEKAEAIEFRLDQWRAEMLTDIFGDFDLGGTVAYALPTETKWDYGYQTVGTIIYRILDLTIGYRLDPVGTFSA